MTLEWKDPVDTKNAAYAIKYLVRLNREVGSIMSYITTNYAKSNSCVIAIHVEKNNIFRYHSYDRISLRPIDTTMSWTKHVNLLHMENNPNILYFSPLPHIHFVKKGTKLFTLENDIMIVNIHFIVHSILTGNIIIQLTGIQRTITGTKRLVSCEIPCGYEMIALIQNSLKDSLFTST
jgi:hypothetical protein